MLDFVVSSAKYVITYYNVKCQLSVNYDMLDYSSPSGASSDDKLPAASWLGCSDVRGSALRHCGA